MYSSINGTTADEEQPGPFTLGEDSSLLLSRSAGEDGRGNERSWFMKERKVISVGAVAGLVMFLICSLSVKDQETGLKSVMPSLFVLDQCGDVDKTQKISCCSDYSKPVLGGIDVVEITKLGETIVPSLGREDFQYNLPGGPFVFWFSSQENLETFTEDPELYIPAWGGFCAWGIAAEEQYQRGLASRQQLGPSTDLLYFHRTAAGGGERGRTFFFGGEGPRQKFLADLEGHTARGDANWEGWFGGAGDAPFEEAYDTNCFHHTDLEILTQLSGMDTQDAAAAVGPVTGGGTGGGNNGNGNGSSGGGGANSSNTSSKRSPSSGSPSSADTIAAGGGGMGGGGGRGSSTSSSPTMGQKGSRGGHL